MQHTGAVRRACSLQTNSFFFFVFFLGSRRVDYVPLIARTMPPLYSMCSRSMRLLHMMFSGQQTFILCVKTTSVSAAAMLYQSHDVSFAIRQITYTLFHSLSRALIAIGTTDDGTHPNSSSTRGPPLRKWLHLHLTSWMSWAKPLSMRSTASRTRWTQMARNRHWTWTRPKVAAIAIQFPAISMMTSGQMP